MKSGIYLRLSIDGIRKNKKLYLPYICAFCGMVIMSYIIFFLTESERITSLSGGDAIHSTLSFGCGIMAIFSCIFIFYTNSFLIRRRKKEYGLYGVLGMGKRQLVAVNFLENLCVTALSLAIGLVLGIALSKFAELGLVRLVGGDTDFSFSVDLTAVAKTSLIFLVCFVLVFLNSARQIIFSQTVTLLNSENSGEKPPKGNVFVAILGLLLLGAAYYVAVTIEDPISAMAWFFVAVSAVIIATYLLMIAGSVSICRLLEKNKGYYYKKNHFVSVSSMAYRMKRNGAGLASICILSTMVLVTVSTTTCMFFGTEDSLKATFPRQINIDFLTDNLSEQAVAPFQKAKSDISAAAQQRGIALSNTREAEFAYTRGSISGSDAYCGADTDIFVTGASEMREFIIISQADYNRLSGESLSLKDGTAEVRTVGCKYTEPTLNFNDGSGFEIVGSAQADRFLLSDQISFAKAIVLVTKDLNCINDSVFYFRKIYGFDTDLKNKEQMSFSKTIEDNLLDNRDGNNGHFVLQSRAKNEGDFYGTYGGVFYLGILLSLVFTLAAVLIIFYKQVTEGYEDQARFEIMAKVGMTKKDIKSSVNSQLLTVFFAPLIFSAAHLCFAFPMIKKILELFHLYNTGLFLLTTALSFAVFALFYIIVYRLTAGAYMSIVGGTQKKVNL